MFFFSLRIGLLLFAFVWLCSSAAIAQAAPKYLRVPVYFVTDRNLDPKHHPKTGGSQFGPLRKYIGDCKHDPFMGSGYCVLENNAGKKLSPELISLGWSAAEAKEKEGVSKVECIENNSFSEIQKKFSERLLESANKSKKKDIILFAHGYKNSFDAALHTAARFSYDFEGPVILYSWPSVAKLKSYTTDENNNEWSQEHFNELLLNLEKLCGENPNVHMRVFAHSLGSRLVVRATPFLRLKDCISEVALICPDIDQGLVKHYARRYLSAEGTCKLRMYMSQADKALVFSQLVHGGYCRLGECADSIASMVVSSVPLPFPFKPTQNEDEEDARYKAILEKTKQRMQTIDFTDFDRGFIGHKIPTEIIQSMSYTDTPGPGLKLIHEKAGRNHLSRMLCSLTLERKDAVMPKDTCLRVVKDDEPSRRIATEQDSK